MHKKLACGKNLARHNTSENIKWIQHSKSKLELRQYKDGFVSVKRMLVLKFVLTMRGCNIKWDVMKSMDASEKLCEAL